MLKKNIISKKKETDWNNLLKEYEAKAKDIESLNLISLSMLPFSATLTGIIMPRPTIFSISIIFDFSVIFFSILAVILPILKYQYDVKRFYAIHLEKQLQQLSHDSPFVFYSQVASRFPLITYLQKCSILFLIIFISMGCILINSPHLESIKLGILFFLVSGLLIGDTVVEKLASAHINQMINKKTETY